MLSFTESRFAGKKLISILLFSLLFSQTIFTQWYQQTSGTTNHLRDVCFLDINKGIAIGDYGTICTTSDGGTTWTLQTSGTGYGLISLCFSDANNGWIVGASGFIMRTTDGGITWAQQISGTNTYLMGVSFTDVNTGTIVVELIGYHNQAELLTD